jgi:hypothetical protein
MPSRYGTGELYGFDFSTLQPERIRELSSAPYKSLACPFKPVKLGNPRFAVAAIFRNGNCLAELRIAA